MAKSKKVELILDRPGKIHPGGSILMKVENLKGAKEQKENRWTVTIEAENVAGIEIPEKARSIDVSLNEKEYKQAIEKASQSKEQFVVFVEHSGKWVEKMQERLMGGFNVEFTESVCKYSQPWS